MAPTAKGQFKIADHIREMYLDPNKKQQVVRMFENCGFNPEAFSKKYRSTTKKEKECEVEVGFEYLSKEDMADSHQMSELLGSPIRTHVYVHYIRVHTHACTDVCSAYPYMTFIRICLCLFTRIYIYIYTHTQRHRHIRAEYASLRKVNLFNYCRITLNPAPYKYIYIYIYLYPRKPQFKPLCKLY